MALRRDRVTRVNEAKKASVPVIGEGKPLNSRGSEGDLTFRRTSDGLKLYIKARGKWHGVLVGESFDNLEKILKKLESRVSTLKNFRLPSTYNVTGDFTLDSSGDITLDADGGQVYIKDGGSSHFAFDCDGTRLTIYDDTDVSDLFKITVAANGATTMATVDNDGTAGHLTLQPNGNLTLDPDSQNVVINSTDKLNFDGRNGDQTYIQESADDILSIYVGGDEMLKIDESVGITGQISSQAPLLLKETLGATADVAAYGQIWVKQTTPNHLWFTNDAGNDIQLTSGTEIGDCKYFYDVQRVGYYATSTGNYIPMTGGTIENTSLTSGNERLAFIAPYNGTIHQVQWRTEIAQDGATSFRILESPDGTEVPGTTTTCRVDETIDIADDTTHTVDLSSLTSGDVNLDKGKIYALYISHPTAPQDTNVTAVFKWDLTS